MSTVTASVAKPVTVPELRARKGGTPIVSLTAYTTPMARRLDPYVDFLLVGDSLGMVVYGFDSTLPVTLDMMIAHGAAVVRGASHAAVVVDLPFASYQASPADAYRAAARVIAETGADAVKLEGGVEMAETVAFLAARDIPVMGHVGLKPQSVRATGGYKIRGRGDSDADRVIADGLAIAEAGAFALVVEGTVEPVARELTQRIEIPTIGIGASAACDGQVLVVDDMLGVFTDFTPKFVKRYAELGKDIEAAAQAYAEEVRSRAFPSNDHLFGGGPSSSLPSGKSPKRA
ncbi:MAG TPA: 3-methyl-2-oxobutanoate hydroxymethyltransferase [Alphaproteobacteria bacterium]|nr:3-methyl-2-oxobutanoate hydroxymethyltransferase [Alphaproteobacteria bacterium]